MNDFWINPGQQPQIITDTPSYLVLYKPPCMHTAPLTAGEENTLLNWAASLYPGIVKIQGKKPIEGGLVHRLDYETHGLVLCAKTQKIYEDFMLMQKAGHIIKEYDAASSVSPSSISSLKNIDKTNTIIQSAFRPFGKGRKAVRPLEPDHVLAAGKTIYQTEILCCRDIKNTSYFRLRIKKGFRHQIRCHLAWIGRPLFNDFLYGSCDNIQPDTNTMQSKAGIFLALRASSIAFCDPVTGNPVEAALPETVPCPMEC